MSEVHDVTYEMESLALVEQEHERVLRRQLMWDLDLPTPADEEHDACGVDEDPGLYYGDELL